MEEEFAFVVDCFELDCFDIVLLLIVEVFDVVSVDLGVDADIDLLIDIFEILLLEGP